MNDHDKQRRAGADRFGTHHSPSGHRGCPPSPSPWVQRFLDGTPKDGPIADVACGSGRHLRLARAMGYAVMGIDRDLAGMDDIRSDPQTRLIETDLEAGGPFPLAPGSCACVIVANYLWRPILSDIIAAVRSDGLLIYETFALGNERFGKPSNPDFLLRPGELIAAITGRLTPIAYEHVTEGSPVAGAGSNTGTGTAVAPLRVRQRIVAAGPDHIWLNEPPNPARRP